MPQIIKPMHRLTVCSAFGILFQQAGKSGMNVESQAWLRGLVLILFRTMISFSSFSDNATSSYYDDTDEMNIDPDSGPVQANLTFPGESLTSAQAFMR